MGVNLEVEDQMGKVLELSWQLSRRGSDVGDLLLDWAIRGLENAGVPEARVHALLAASMESDPGAMETRFRYLQAADVPGESAVGMAARCYGLDKRDILWGVRSLIARRAFGEVDLNE